MLDSPLNDADLGELDAGIAAAFAEGCTTYSSADDDDAEELDFIERKGFEKSSAGEVLVLATPAGTLAELVRDRGYQPSSEYIDGVLPEGTTVDVPGDEFPAFAARAVPVVESVRDVTVTSDASGALTPASRITWAAPSSSGQPVNVDLFGTVGTGRDSVLVSCTTADDGEFTLPAELRETIESARFEQGSFDVSRHGTTMERSGDALLLISYTHRSGVGR